MPGILVGIDGSHYSERALEWAMKEAALRHQPLKVLAVHPVIKGWTGEGVVFPVRTSRSSERGRRRRRPRTRCWPA